MAETEGEVMAYDSSKDRVLAIRAETFGKANLEVRAVSYDGGDPKIQLARFRYTKDKPHEPRYLKVGRLTFDEARWVCGAIAEIMRVTEETAQRSDDEAE